MNTRKVIRNTVAVVLFSFLIIAFAITGVTNDFLRPTQKNVIIKVGPREISAVEFKKFFDEEREAAKQQIGRAMTPDEAVARQVDKGILKALLDNAVRHTLFERLGIKASPKVVAENLRENPAFFDPVTGRFDQVAYQRTIGDRGWTPQRFEDLLAGEVATSHFAQAIQFGVEPPASLAALQAAIFLENRDASYVLVTPATVGVVAEPTDDQLMKFMNENSSRLMLDERREMSFVRLSASKYLADVKLDAAEVQKLVDFRKSQSATPETRTLVQIPAKDRAAAASISQRLTKGEDPAAIAKSVGASVVNYANKAKADIPDRKIADAAFALPAGQVSGPIQGDLGFAVVKVVGVTASKAGDDKALRTQAEAELKARAAETKVSEAADKLEEAISKGAKLEDAATAAGLTVVKAPGIDAQGRGLRTSAPVTGLSAKLIQTAFGLQSGSTSEFETEQPGEYYIVRVDKIIPASLPPLAEIRAPLANDWKNIELDRRLTTKANEVAARLRKGEAIETVAASLGVQPVRIANLSANNAQPQVAQYGNELIGAVLRGKKGDVQVTRVPQPGAAIVKIDAIKPGDPNEIARVMSGVRSSVQQQLQKEMFDSFAVAAQTAVKAQSYPDRALQAVGATPKAEAKADDKAKAK